MATSTPAAPPEYPDKIDAAVLKIAGVVVLGSIMSILDITVVNVALPTFQEELGVENYSTVAWTVTAYTLALAAVIPLTGWAADRFGTKRLYMLALGLFTAGSVLCAAAWNIETLIGFRVLQGLGGGMLMPLGMTILTKAAGPERMGRLMAILGIPMLLGPILGPIIGGFLIDNASWHWIFLINLPLGLGALIYAWRVLDQDAPHPSESFDFIGMALMSPGLALFLYGVSSIPDAGGMGEPKVWATMLVGGLLVAAFIVYSFRPKHPLLDFRLFRNYNLSISTLTMFIFAGAFFGGLLLVPTYFQQVGGETPLKAGLLVAPQGLGAMLTMPLAGVLADRFPVGRVVPFGLALICGGMFALTSLEADTGYGYIIAALFVMGLGMGLTMMPLMTSALRTLQSHEVARGSTLLNISQQIASSVGVAIISVVLTNQMKDSRAVQAAQALSKAEADQVPADPSLLDYVQSLGARFESLVLSDMAHAFAASFVVAFWLCVVALVVSLFLPKRREAARLLDDQGQPPVMMH
ncbi:DHA2 family efflux MFS transporter permease subunit [Aeromicrobium sp. 636]|uniref:DHA2 family efflux MFS transporter permease subunit n=1 Tax=Aeromicrobium senzhongii TaxID=2663859 RepID=A0A8I0EXK6_9ACTN|nr:MULTISPECIES: DHA2 family efflux MFS transporter permease subunit [Aeromicrobium]MBC9227237.1 DHA2 family efflux MFS transporter permease subunit [Aeromicrobium senzhongii]MCQ3999336.1 DHA2 family efflux MFS transporter permease subunit [Aeromicrobium sp. 636]